jgi:S-adenosyl methyltransferase
MPAEPQEPSGLDPDDPVGTRYPDTARIWNYQLGGKDNFAVDREASLIVPESPEHDRGAAWHLCGVGIKGQP